MCHKNPLLEKFLLLFHSPWQWLNLKFTGLGACMLSTKLSVDFMACGWTSSCWFPVDYCYSVLKHVNGPRPLSLCSGGPWSTCWWSRSPEKAFLFYGMNPTTCHFILALSLCDPEVISLASHLLNTNPQCGQVPAMSGLFLALQVHGRSWSFSLCALVSANW